MLIWNVLGDSVAFLSRCLQIMKTSSNGNIFRVTGPCITNVFATRRKNFSQWYRSFQRKLLSHWLKFLRHVAITLVIQGPGPLCGEFTEESPPPSRSLWRHCNVIGKLRDLTRSYYRTSLCIEWNFNMRHLHYREITACVLIAVFPIFCNFDIFVCH